MLRTAREQLRPVAGIQSTRQDASRAREFKHVQEPLYFTGAQVATSAVHYIPILTTILSAIFALELWNKYQARSQPRHLLWWCFGFICYGAGTALESAVTLLGNSVELTKAWYIAGAVLGGYPLAQGSVYLHLARRTADRLNVVTVAFAVAVSVLVLLSPVDVTLLEAHRPSGRILEWQWVRGLTPILNTYAAIFLIGSAIWSSVRFFRLGSAVNRAKGNALIAFGALLPGIGGAFAKAGMVEALYVGEFIGILFIWTGYRFCSRESAYRREHSAPQEGLSRAA